MGPQDRLIVVADDDEAMRLLCRVNLELEGYRVREAGSAAEIEQALATEGVAIVILDIHLGNDDGMEIAQRLRAEHPGVAVAFLSGSAHLGERAASLSDAAIRKPFNLEELIETVHQLARR
jgi:DNA-binding response OmpR family regulator